MEVTCYGTNVLLHESREALTLALETASKAGHRHNVIACLRLGTLNQNQSHIRMANPEVTLDICIDPLSPKAFHFEWFDAKPSNIYVLGFGLLVRMASTLGSTLSRYCM